jgi:hypothetical protein
MEQLSAFQRALSCVSASVARLGLNDRPTDTWEINPGTAVSVGTGRSGLAVELKQFWAPSKTAAGWTVDPVGYSYVLFERATSVQTLAYHWHPTGRSHVDTPHLHLGPPLLAAMGVQRSIHLPSGHIELAEFLEMLIRELEVRPARRDWRRVLAELSHAGG